MSKTNIEWAGETWNPTLGCTLIAPGCRSCYAMRDAYRKQFHPNPKISEAYVELTQLTNGHPVWTGKVNLMEDRLSIPLRKRKPTTWFVDSMSDLFHADVPDEFIDRVFAVMALCQRHRFIVLTKRSGRMADYFRDNRSHIVFKAAQGDINRQNPGGKWINLAGAWPLPNVILGASASDQTTFDAVVPAMRTLAGAEWNTVWSLEPLLGPINIGKAACASWIIVGGESGPGARPCDTRWIRDIVRQCAAAYIPCFVKQFGANPISSFTGDDVDAGRIADEDTRYIRDRKGGDMAEWPEDLRVRQMPEVLR